MLPPFKLEEFWKTYEFTAPYILSLSDAENWTLKEILELTDPETKELWETLSLGYTQVPGHPLLREEIAKLYTHINADQVVTLAGGEEGIYCTMKALLSPSDHAIVITPCYQSLETLARASGAEITTIAINPQNNWKLNIEELKRAFRPSTKMVILNYPHNPSGSLLEKEMFDTLIDLARKNGAYLFCDEMYRYLEIDPRKRLPAFADAYEKGISLFGMTKPFGLAGLRIGWVTSQDRSFLDKFVSYKVYTSICNSAPSEILAIIALRAKDKLLSRAQTIVQTNLQILDRFFDRHKNSLSWVRPESGTMAVAKFLLPVPIEIFAKELLEKTGVLIMPGAIFDFPGNYFRIGFGRKNFPDVLNRFEEFLVTYENLH